MPGADDGSGRKLEVLAPAHVTEFPSVQQRDSDISDHEHSHRTRSLSLRYKYSA